MNNLPILLLKKGRERSIWNRHPWIFSGAVQKLPQAQNGEIIEVRDIENKLLGYGFFSPKSQIVCRMFEFTQESVDFTTAAYWDKKIATAYQLRQAFINPAETNAYRLLHAEGDFFPGIIADVYDKVVVLQLLIKGTAQLLPFILASLQKLGFAHIYLKNKTNSDFLEEVNLTNGWLTEPFAQNQIEVLENGLKFIIDFEKGQKTGFFIDQRENRALVKNYAKDKHVLNLFSYTGGFSMYALAGDAKSVDSVDVSKSAMQICEENIAINGYKEDIHGNFAEDCFDYLKSTTKQYDLMILDPPAFAKNARSVPNATRGYKELNLLAFKKINPGGIVFTFSCSQNIDKDLFRKIVFGAAADARRNVRILHQLTQPLDHPINIFHPEGEYLKGLVLHVE